jgi:hypothetical protein
MAFFCFFSILSKANHEVFFFAVGSIQGPGIRLIADNGIYRRTPKERSGDRSVSDYSMGLPLCLCGTITHAELTAVELASFIPQMPER